MQRGIMPAEASKSGTPQNTHQTPEQCVRRYGCKYLQVEKSLDQGLLHPEGCILGAQLFPLGSHRSVLIMLLLDLKLLPLSQMSNKHCCGYYEKVYSSISQSWFLVIAKFMYLFHKYFWILQTASFSEWKLWQGFFFFLSWTDRLKHKPPSSGRNHLVCLGGK